MTPHTLWTRVKNIGAAAVEAGGYHAGASILPASVPQVLRHVTLQERDEVEGDPEPHAVRQHRDAVQALR
jgi:hypothetical protein